ncbi:BPA1, partial [Symbiodinium sp. KB8]
VELPDGATAASCLLTNLCTVRCVITHAAPAAGVPASHSTAPPRAPDAATEATPAPAALDPSGAPGSFVSATELRCAVVVTGLPPDRAEATHAAVLEAFSVFGAVQRIVTQDDPPAAGTSPGSSARAADAAHSPLDRVPPAPKEAPSAAAGSSDSGTQHAVIVFADEVSAVAALALDRHRVMGARVRVSLATSLSGSGAGDGDDDDDDDASGASTIAAAVDVLSSWLAGGITLGRKGAAHVQEMSQRHGVTDTVRRAVASLKARAKKADFPASVTRPVAARAAAIDEEYRVRARAAAATAAASAAVSSAASRAMENSSVRAGVTAVSAAASRVGTVVADVGRQTVAKAEAMRRQSTSPDSAAPDDESAAKSAPPLHKEEDPSA